MNFNQVSTYIDKKHFFFFRYKMIKHNPAKPNPRRERILRENPKLYGKDGLKDLRYKIEKIDELRSHTRIVVSLRK